MENLIKMDDLGVPLFSETPETPIYSTYSLASTICRAMRERCRCWWIWSCLALAEVILGEETEWLIWRNGTVPKPKRLFVGFPKYKPGITWLVVSNMFYFHPYLGKISNLTNIFQLGWNHQLETHTIHVCYLHLLDMAGKHTQSMDGMWRSWLYWRWNKEANRHANKQTNKHNQKLRSTKKAGKKTKSRSSTTKKKTNTGK